MTKSNRKPMSRAAQVEAQLPQDFHTWTVEKRQLYMRQEKNLLDQLGVRYRRASTTHNDGLSSTVVLRQGSYEVPSGLQGLGRARY